MHPFHFKQFTIQHSQSGHKVGTDGVLLGAWTDLKFRPYTILDIGAGTGLISLIMAQRSAAEQIDAIEINPDAYEECVLNFENSAWNDRLFCYHGDILEFADEPDLKYDLIISNPPFFERNTKGSLNKRTVARQHQLLTYEDLIRSVSKLLSENGQFSTIIPFSDHEEFNSKSENFHLFPFKITQVKGHENTGYKRSLIQFSFQSKPLKTDELIIEKARHDYTEAYKNLVKDFYLKL
jgi:tRNA1Val (adenine37-N6)-methyltransferase